MTIRAVVIGAGLGGLSAAIRLAAAGFAVTVLEQQEEAGGKLQRVEQEGYRFDRGASTITMPEAFERVFRTAGRKMENYVQLNKLAMGARNIFADGHVVDFSSDCMMMEEQIAAYSIDDAIQYRAFMKESKKLHDYAREHFINRLLLSWQDKLDPGLAAALLRVRPFTSLNRLLERYFRHPHTLAMFGRFATYVGSAPSRAPAIFAMLPHLEIALGTYSVKGGTYAIAEGFRRLADELGVVVHTSVKVRKIVSHHNRVSAVETSAGDYPAELVVANGDVMSIYSHLVEEKQRPEMTDQRITKYEPSLSGFVILAGIRRKYKQLLHHTVFFPEQYGQEFTAIFDRRTAPSQPAIYICHAGHSEAGMAPRDGSNLFIMANAPYLSDSWRWDQHKAQSNK